MSGRVAAILAIPVLIAVGLGLWLISKPSPPPRLALIPVAFEDLSGWADDDHAAAAAALRRSCERWQRLPDDRPVGRNGIAGTVGDWRPICAAALALPPDVAAPARAFFEARFRPYAVSVGGDAEGLFTGYYEAALRGRREPGDAFATPLLAKPDDLVMVDLGRFRDDLAGERIAGRVVDGRLFPYATRADIDAGALAGRDLELVWVDDPVDAFFLHIQGSGRVALPDGGDLRVGYAGHNGHPYFAIGRELIRRGAMTRETVSMQSIRQWLADNPDEAEAVMQLNPSFIFFRPLDTDGPLGAQGVVLTPGRSLAVDRRHVPLGLPVWLDASAPSADGGDDQPLRRLMVAQDTGGAIRGPVRGDVYWGGDAAAAEIAGRMKHPGRWYLLLPRSLPTPGVAAD